MADSRTDRGAGLELTPGRRLAYWVLLLLGTIAVAELLVRVFLSPPGLYPKPQETPVLEPDAVKGYALRPGASGHYAAGGYRAPIRINERGFRDGAVEEAVRAEVRALAVGDSFTFGLGVDADDPWPQQLESLLRREGGDASVLNAGVPGYSARQMRQVAAELLPELDPQFLVLGVNSETYWRVEEPYVFYGGQIVRPSWLPPGITVGRKGLYFSRIARWPWLARLDIWLNQHFELGAHGLHLLHVAYGRMSQNDGGAGRDAEQYEMSPTGLVDLLAPLLAEIRHTRELAAAHGVEAVVLLVNPQLADGSFAPVQYEYNRIVGAYCRERGIRVVDPLPVLADSARGRTVMRSVDDYHWSRLAHAIAANELYAYLVGQGLLPHGPPETEGGRTPRRF